MPALAPLATARRAPRPPAAAGRAGLPLAGALLAALGAVPGTTPAARADVTFTMEVDGTSRTMQMSESKMRSGDGSRVMVFDGPAGTMTTIDTASRSYQVIDKEQLKAAGAQMRAQMDAMRAQLEARMAGMPPEQRAMVEKMMAGQGGMPGMPGMPGAPSPVPTVKYEPMGKTREIHGWTTKGYTVLENGQPAGEVWTAQPAALGITDADLAPFGHMRSFVNVLTEGMGGAFGALGSRLADPMLFDPSSDDFLGIPVRRERPDGGVIELVKVDKGKLDPKLFAVPEGYTRASSPLGPGGPGMGGPPPGVAPR